MSIPSAPLSTKPSIASSDKIFSESPAACIFPANTKPLKYFFAVSIAAIILAFETPVAGFPVSKIKSTPCLAASSKASLVALLPAGSFISVSKLSAFSSTGSKFIPTGFPVRFFIKAIGSSSTSPLIYFVNTSYSFRSSKSAPKADITSAFVIFSNKGAAVTTVSPSIVLPSLAIIAFFNSAGDILIISLATQLNSLFFIYVSFLPLSYKILSTAYHPTSCKSISISSVGFSPVFLLGDSYQKNMSYTFDHCIILYLK